MLPQWFQHHTITKMFYVISLTVMTQLSQGPGKVTSKCVKMVDLELKGFIIKLRKQKSKVSQIIKTGSATQTNKESKQKKSFLIFEGLVSLSLTGCPGLSLCKTQAFTDMSTKTYKSLPAQKGQAAHSDHSCPL